ncbi:unnamed protein product [Scytosiphon promiscuus]
MGRRLRPSLNLCSCLLGPVVALYTGGFVRRPLAGTAASWLQYRGIGRRQQHSSSARRTRSTLLPQNGTDERHATGGEQAVTQPRSEAPTTAASGILAPILKERRLLKVDDDDLDTILLYFAFGANMCPSVFTTKRGVKPLASLPAEALRFASSTTMERNAISDGKSASGFPDERSEEAEICVCFCHRAGYATLVQKPGPPQTWKASPGAHGVLHAISADDLNTIAASENGYRKRLVEVATTTGEKDIAVCFVSNPSQTLPTSVPPTSRYLALLLEGAMYHGVNEAYTSWLAGLPSVPPEHEATSRERINTPSKRALDATLAVLAVATLGAAGVAVYPF